MAKRIQGHYCKVCGEYKANEKFSGRGHAAHICKKCAALPLAKRNDAMAINKIDGMAFRHLSQVEINWLRKKMHDENEHVRDAAKRAHDIKFPHYERNLLKKGLTARALEFYIYGAVLDEYGDELTVHMRFFADNAGVVRRVDYDAPESEQETAVNIGQPAALRFLKTIVQQMDAPFWGDDLSDTVYSVNPYLDILPEYSPDLDDDNIESYNDGIEWAKPSADDREPLWSLRLVLNKGGEITQAFYNQMPDEPQTLLWALMDLFEDDEDENPLR
jgi:hypothetical protein